jgi:hypothetical protein
MCLCGSEASADDAGDESRRAVPHEYLRGHGGRARAWYLSVARRRWPGGT